jgi:hypothetical protein
MILSGNAQSAPSHTALAMPTIVRLTDGTGTPLNGRTVTLTTTSVTSTAYAATTDAAGQASFHLRAGLALTTETITFHALGVPDVTGTVTATAQATGNVFSLLNGPRNTMLSGYGGPTYDASLSGGAPGYVAAGADGNVFFGWDTGTPYDDHIYRIRPDGVVEVFAGNQPYFAGVSIPEGSLATAINLGSVQFVRMAYDQPRGLLYMSVGCGIYSIDMTTRLVHHVLGDAATCSHTGDLGRAIDATSYAITSIAVNDLGMIYFTANQAASGGPPLRMIDTGGVVSLILQGGTVRNGINIGTFGPLSAAALPGTTDVLFVDDCPGLAGVCVVRTDVGGNRTMFAGFGTDRVTDGVLAATQMQIDANYPGEILIATSPAGEVYITQYNVGTIRRIDPTGHVFTVAGVRGMLGDSGDGGPGTSATMRSASTGASWLGTHFAFLDGANRSVRAIW